MVRNVPLRKIARPNSFRPVTAPTCVCGPPRARHQESDVCDRRDAPATPSWPSRDPCVATSRPDIAQRYPSADGHTDRTVGLVDMLAAGAGSPVVHANIARVDLDVHFPASGSTATVAADG